jgi:hypothetical protein
MYIGMQSVSTTSMQKEEEEEEAPSSIDFPSRER